jgi:hypothetical protein
MTKKFIIVSFIVGMGLISFMSGSQEIYSVEEESRPYTPPNHKLIISHKEIFGKLERPHVKFDHRLHADTYKKEGCSICHTASSDKNLIFTFPFQVTNQSREAVMDAFHEKCVGCHLKLSRTKKKAGFVRCGDCHRKQFESAEITYPVCEFDFSLHDRHAKKLNSNCGFCHHSYDKEDKELVYEQGTEQSCFYCHDLEAKRGPFLASEIEVTKNKGLAMRKVSHHLCVNCHLSFAQQQLKAGPLECAECHTGKYRTVSELLNVPRPDRDQPQKPLIIVEGGMMKGVSFDHKSHQKSSLTCRACHHETLSACKRCHTLTGMADGKWITTVAAYHDIFSQAACAGCHAKEKEQKNCAGCHHHLLDIDLPAKGSKKEFCIVCHSGRRDKPAGKPIRDASLIPQEVPEKVTVKILENEYDPATFPHLKIIRRLTEISNKSDMAGSFHRDIRTICRGCHHQSAQEAEARKHKPPFCRNCHPVSFDQQNMNRPRLLAVYHQQCMGCHEKMKIKALGCEDCHKRKPTQVRDVL